MYQRADYTYFLPPDRIAQYPTPKRDTSRLFCLDRQAGSISHHVFSDIFDLLSPGDVLVINDTKVIPGRLFASKETGGKAEILLLGYPSNSSQTPILKSLIKSSKQPKVGSFLYFEDDLKVQVVGHENEQTHLQFSSLEEVDQILSKYGHMPLPPYIRKGEDSFLDIDTYQTVYASQKGAVAAPTAGLHFTKDLLTRLSKKGIEIVSITLHVGYGTFIPVRTDDIRDHVMHPESFFVSKEAADRLTRAKKEGRRIIAVGTTCVRTLEYIVKEKEFSSQKGVCDLFIYPGFSFKAVDGMITNFHLPQSTLLMLVSAFTGKETILNAYQIAIEEKYRFYSYGDAMLIL